MPRVRLLALVAACCACAPSDRMPTFASEAAQQGRADAAGTTFTSFDVPGAASTFPQDINSAGDVVGQFASGGLTHGFLRSAAGHFTTIDYPGALNTVAFGINSEGDIVGAYALVVTPGPLTERHGFVLRNGEFTPFDLEGSKFTNPLGINAAGDIVGRFCTALPCMRPGSGNYHGFLWHNGEITTFDVPGSRETNAWKINAEGQIVGAFRTAGGPNRLFTLRGTEFVTFDLPGVLPVAQDEGGMNARGDIAGVYCDASPCDFTIPTHGFVLRQGELTRIDYPGARSTKVVGINARGDLVGAYNDGSIHGFVLNRED
jgi:uncharacterized membrane protein